MWRSVGHEVTKTWACPWPCYTPSSLVGFLISDGWGRLGGTTHGQPHRAQHWPNIAVVYLFAQLCSGKKRLESLWYPIYQPHMMSLSITSNGFCYWLQQNLWLCTTTMMAFSNGLPSCHFCHRANAENILQYSVSSEIIGKNIAKNATKISFDIWTFEIRHPKSFTDQRRHWEFVTAPQKALPPLGVLRRHERHHGLSTTRRHPMKPYQKGSLIILILLVSGKII